MKISVIVPVYRRPKRVGDIIGKLLVDTYENKEIVVVVDGGTNPEIESSLEGYRDRIAIHYNEGRLGKVDSLNSVSATLQTDVFVFLDNDIILPDDPGFLLKTSEMMAHNGIIEFPKEAASKKSIVSRMMRYEFLGFAMTEYVFTKLSGRCPSMNGAAFAVRKRLFDSLGGFAKVVNEDMDLAARAFMRGTRFGYDPGLKVLNEVPASVPEWLIQRKRWALNNILWLRTNMLMLMRSFFKFPSLIVTMVLLLLPFFSYIVVLALMRHLNLTSILPVIFMTAQHFHALAGVFLWIVHVELIFIDGMIPTAIGLASSGLLYFIFARFLRFKFNPFEYILFYFVYSPIWMLTNVIMWLLVILRVDIKLDWKV